jgi:uncharacterized protein (TIGR03546 family)
MLWPLETVCYLDILSNIPRITGARGMALSFPGRSLIIPNGVSFIQLVLTFLYGSWLGFSPGIASLHLILLLLSLCIIRLPLVLLLIVTASCWALGMVGVDRGIDALGLMVLREPALKGLWTQMYNAPVLPWTRFNNSMVMGATVLAFALVPVWIGMSLTIRRSLRA